MDKITYGSIPYNESLTEALYSKGDPIERFYDHLMDNDETWYIGELGNSMQIADASLMDC